MLAVMYLLTRGLFKVGFEWRRLAPAGRDPRRRGGLGRAAAADGRSRRVSRSRVAWLVLVPSLLLGTHFFHPHERAQARALVADGRRRVAAFRRGHGDVEEYADDPLRDI